MAQYAFADTVRFTADSTGLGDFVVSTVVGGYKTPEQAFATDGKEYHYFAQNADGSMWEEGRGTYTYSSDTLARTTILANHLGTTAKVNFTAAPPTVDVFPSPLPLLENDGIPAGSRTVWWQASAPLGWTKLTTYTEYALRVISGGTGGSMNGNIAFSTVFARTATDAKTLVLSETPAHGHGYNYATGLTGFPGAGAIYMNGADTLPLYLNALAGSTTTGSQGGGGSHTHGIDLRVYYADMIMCEKN